MRYCFNATSYSDRLACAFGYQMRTAKEVNIGVSSTVEPVACEGGRLVSAFSIIPDPEDDSLLLPIWAFAIIGGFALIALTVASVFGAKRQQEKRYQSKDLLLHDLFLA